MTRKASVRSVLAVAARHPRHVWRILRASAARLLDEEFDRSSPIPVLPHHWTRSIYQFEVVVPPPRLMLPGNQSLEGMIFLVSLGKLLGLRNVFEIGTYNGLTAWCFARNMPDAIVHTLDLPADAEPALDWDATDRSNRLRLHKRAYEVLPHFGTVIQLMGDSALFDFSPWRGRCDLVYIDGAHTEEYVRSDTRNALDILSERGVIVWDDYGRRIEGVKSVLHSTANLSLYRVPGTRLAIHLGVRAESRLAGASLETEGMAPNATEETP